MFYDRFSLTNYLNTLQLNGTTQQKATFINPGATCTPVSPTGCGTSATSRATLYTLGNGIRSSYTMQAAVGLDQQLGRAATMSVNYLSARGVHEYMTRNFYDQTIPGTTAPTTPYSYQYQSAGVYRQNQIMFNGNARLPHMNLFGFYAISFANANTSGAGFFPTSNTDTKVDYGRATFAFRQFGVFGGSLNFPHGVTASPFMIAQAGTPYNITTGTDPFGSSIYNTRPYFRNGSSGNCFNGGDFSTSGVGGLTPVPINYCTGPANVSINLRVAKVIGFGPKTGGAAAGGANQGQNRRGGQEWARWRWRWARSWRARWWWTHGHGRSKFGHKYSPYSGSTGNEPLQHGSLRHADKQLEFTTVWTVHNSGNWSLQFSHCCPAYYVAGFIQLLAPITAKNKGRGEISRRAFVCQSTTRSVAVSTSKWNTDDQNCSGDKERVM